MFGNNAPSSLSKTIGYTKNKTFNFKKVKEDIMSKKSRFKKKTPNVNLEPLSSSKSQTLLTRRPSDTYIEMGGTGALPPVWVDIYEETQEKIRKIHEISKEEQKLVAKRIKQQFGDHTDLDKQIDKKSSDATRLLHECETNLTRISQMGADETESQSKIRKNIQRSLATQIQEAAALLRRQQKGLLDKLQDLNNTGGSTDIDLENNDYSEDLKDMMLAEDIARERDEDINRLIDNINELSHLFKQMNQIVIEQGTIVDRIDYHLEQAVDHTKKAKKELVKAKKAMDSKCAQNVIKILIILNVIFSILLVLKFSK
jgi:syntaxin 16